MSFAEAGETSTQRRADHDQTALILSPRGSNGPEIMAGCPSERLGRQGLRRAPPRSNGLDFETQGLQWLRNYGRLPIRGKRLNRALPWSNGLDFEPKSSNNPEIMAVCPSERLGRQGLRRAPPQSTGLAFGVKGLLWQRNCGHLFVLRRGSEDSDSATAWARETCCNVMLWACLTGFRI